MQRLITKDGKIVILKDDGTWAYEKPAGSALAVWKSLKIPANVLELFKGLFTKAGVSVMDTGEAFTCLHHGDRIELIEGLDEKKVDFTVELYRYQIVRLAEHVSKGRIDELEQFHVARALFSRKGGGGANPLKNPLMSHPVLRRIIRGKNLIHACLRSPDAGEEKDAHFTLIYVNESWLVVPGLYGQPGRVFNLTVSDALELQKQLFAGMKADKVSEWVAIAKWYVEWRKRVEAPAQ